MKQIIIDVLLAIGRFFYAVFFILEGLLILNKPSEKLSFINSQIIKFFEFIDINAKVGINQKILSWYAHFLIVTGLIILMKFRYSWIFINISQFLQITLIINLVIFSDQINYRIDFANRIVIFILAPCFIPKIKI